MKQARYILILVGFAMWGLAASGALELSTSAGGRLQYRFRENFLSDKVKKDLKSGISTQVIFLSRLVELPDKVVAEQVVTFESRYDLWSENFQIKVNGEKRVFATQAEVEKWMEGQSGIEFVPTTQLTKGARYRLDAVETVNPLNQERLKSVQNWLIQQKLTSRGSTSSEDIATARETSRSAVSGLIYNLWERAAAGELLTGELRREDRLEFTPESLSPAKGDKP